MTIAPISSELDAQARCRYAKLCSDDSGGDSSSKETLDIKATSALQSQALSTPQAKPAQGTLPPLGGHLLQAWEILGELEVIFGFGRQKNIDYTTVNWERYAIVPKQQAIGFQSFIASCVCLLALSANAMGILATKKLRLPSMCPERKAQLRRTLYVLEKIKKKVQQWLHSGVPLIGQPDSALPPVTAFRSIRARDHVLRLQEAVKLMSFALDEIGNVEVLAEKPSSIVEEPTGVQDASVVEVNVEVDECLSISTKIRSSKYGVTYTESLASGITFDYTALFPGPRC
jgi:hypothetical protein